MDSRERFTTARQVSIRGIVQGVGFRPFVYRLATENHLTGWVLNRSSGVEIHVEGTPEGVDTFLDRLKTEAPPMASVVSLEITGTKSCGYPSFQIRESEKNEGYQLISPDIATCPECLRELFDPSDRRYRYPFINCTNCGPRFTIIKDIPYDRPSTTMAPFVMCAPCREEYENPYDRRFHAQPNACPECGPKVWLADRQGNALACDDVLDRTSHLLKTGHIVAIKGLGGFLLACDATNSRIVSDLRERKRRRDKPFAVMVKNLTQAGEHCIFDEGEASLLASPRAPIVLLSKRTGSEIAPEVAPGNNYLGVMLPYTPIHHILMAGLDIPLVMTSGNLSEEPIAAENREALDRLSGITDYFLFHDRHIHSRYDDSVIFQHSGHPRPLRRARGLAPHPVGLPLDTLPLLATGAQEKSTFCLARDRYAFLSQHIGDLDNVETLEHFERTVALYKRLFRVEPRLIAHDMHPDYLSTGYALRQQGVLPLLAVQHHHAHVASCMADNRLGGEVIGIVFDGSGFGTDNTVWGGEFLVAGYTGYRRMGHFEQLPLPGGELAIRRPYRLAIAYLYKLLGRLPSLPFLEGLSRSEADMVIRQAEQGLNAPLTSSCGRLFDAVSALLGLSQTITFEGQAAILLEMQSEGGAEVKPFPYHMELVDGVWQIRLRPLFQAIVTELESGVPISRLAAAFHETVALMAASVASLISQETGLTRAVLSGGCFQNRLLLERTTLALTRAGLTPFIHRDVPCNDGGIALGQTLIAAHWARERFT